MRKGLAACWMCAPLFCPEVVRASLDLPPAWQPQGLVTLGFPADAGRDRPRKPLAAFVRYAAATTTGDEVVGFVAAGAPVSSRL